MSEKNINYIWCIGLFVLGPLVMTQGYSNITITKFTVYGVMTIATFFGVLLYRYFDYVRRDTYAQKTCMGRDMRIITAIVGIYFILNIISCLVSGNILGDIVAASDKHMGMFYVILMLMLFWASWRMKLQETDRLVRIAVLGTIVTICFAMLQFLGIDFGNLLGRLAIDERGNFLSTMGNTAVFGKFCCIVCPVEIYLLWESKSVLDKVFLRILSALFFVSIVISNIDAAFLGGTVALVSLLLLSVRQKKLTYYMQTIEYGILGCIVFILLTKIQPNTRHLSKMGRAVEGMFWAELLILVIIAIVMCTKKKSNRHLSEAARKLLYRGIWILIILLVSLSVTLFVYCSMINREAEIGILTRYFRFDEDWGTQRGIVWKWCAEIYTKLPIGNKLFGAGHGRVPQLLMEGYYENMTKDLGFYFDNAHNVYLHQLISIGMAGTLSYIVLIGATVAKALKNKYTVIFAVGILVSCVMDMVSIYEPISNPYLWILMGLAMRPTLNPNE